VLAHDDDQRAVAERTRDALAERTGKSVETPVEDYHGFTLSEDYHQKYELRSTPVVSDELEAILGDAFVDSTVAARLNGFVAGHGDADQREALLAALDLPPAVLSEVHRRL
jgi:peptide-methionine (S)-S-oxide reductase